MSKRGHGEGTIFQKPNGRWVAQVSAGYNAKGGRVRKKRTARTKTEAQRLLREMQREVDDGLPSARADMTVADLLDFFTETVLESKDLSQNTIDNHEWAIETHLKPGLGRAKLRTLTVSDVERFLTALRDDRGLSRSSLGRLRGTLARAINEGQRREWVHRNVADLTHVPKSHTKQHRAMNRDQISALLTVAMGHRLEALIKLGLTRGLRPGELLGLRWQNLDLDADQPTVRVSASLKRTGTELSIGGLKTPSSHRELALPSAIVTDLRRHHRQQAKQRLAIGGAWADLDLVFPNEVGGLLDPGNLRREFNNLCRSAAIGDWTPYELRHTAVSLLSEGGVPIEQLADLAGHKDARTTMAVYRHRVASVIDGGASIADNILTAEVESA